MTKTKKFYLVSEDILPEAMLKTVQVKDMMARGECATVNDGVVQVQLSRSAFYKYRDLVFAYESSENRHLLTVLLILEHRQGVLSAVLNSIAGMSGNIVTINQGIPMSEAALATLTMDMGTSSLSPDEMIECLENLIGVRKAEIVGYTK